MSDRLASASVASSRPSSSRTGWSSSSSTSCSRSSSSSTPADNKGLLVVGNYGTGKSHLMAVISAIAEHAELAKRADQPHGRRQGLARRRSLQGHPRRDQLHQMPLRQFVWRRSRTSSPNLACTSRFPPEDRGVEQQGRVRLEMMAAFTAVPRQGAALRLDELLDYLRSNKEQELMRNLNFLRAVGEFCQGLALPLHRRRPGEPLRQPALPVRGRQPAAREGPLRADAHRSRGRRVRRLRAAAQEGREAAGAGARAPDQVRAALRLDERADGRVRPALPRAPGLPRDLRAGVRRGEARGPQDAERRHPPHARARPCPPTSRASSPTTRTGRT
jgi:hypothetical protein